MKIKAAVVNKVNGKFDIEDIQLDSEIRSTEVLVKIVATGICHTDLAIRDQFIPFPMPAILGHEGAGIVEKIGSAVTKVKAGDHVVLSAGSCGECEQCISGHPSYCSNFMRQNFYGKRIDNSCPYHNHNGKEMGGFFFSQSSFATYSIATQANVVKVEKDVSLEILGPLGCGIQTGAGSVLNIMKPKPGDSLVIYGVGSVGLSALMAAKVAGCDTIVAVDIHNNRLELAKEMGATHVINSRQNNASEIIRTEIAIGGMDFSMDTTGRNEIINDAILSLKPKGHCVLAVIGGEKLEVNGMTLNGKSITYGIEGDSIPDLFIPRLIRLYKKGLFPFDKMIKIYHFDEINQAVEDSEKGSTIKAVLRI